MVNVPQILLANWPKLTANGLTKTCIYHEMDDSGYIPGNAVTKPILNSYPDTEIVFDQRVTSVSSATSGGLGTGSTIRSIQQLAIFPSLLLPVVPKINDLIVDPDSRQWEVTGIIEDPADAHHELLIQPITP